MPTYLAIDHKQLETSQGYWTAKEICQQPVTWQKAISHLQQNKAEINRWLTPLLAQTNLRIILTGAGTSAYIGETLAPHLTQVLQRKIEAISTTELVSNPNQHLLAKVPTLLISYARSGNSPESVGAFALADQLVEQCYHLVITCNKSGQLAQIATNNERCYSLLMPDETLDQSFAMTSSFTTMTLSTLWLFAPNQAQFDDMILLTNSLLANKVVVIETLAKQTFKRVAFLGSGSLLGTATEASLKMLELSGGRIDCYAESPLGFRHGPKSMIDQHTLVVLLASNNSYNKQYDLDLFDELKRENKTPYLVDLSDHVNEVPSSLTDVWLSFPYIVFSQILAFYKSLSLEITPDNPCISGEVNRVVQGVTIYPFES